MAGASRGNIEERALFIIAFPRTGLSPRNRTNREGRVLIGRGNATPGTRDSALSPNFLLCGTVAGREKPPLIPGCLFLQQASYPLPVGQTAERSQTGHQEALSPCAS